MTNPIKPIALYPEEEEEPPASIDEESSSSNSGDNNDIPVPYLPQIHRLRFIRMEGGGRGPIPQPVGICQLHRRVLENRVKQLEELTKRQSEMIEAMWDAPGMPGAQQWQEESDKLLRKRAKTGDE